METKRRKATRLLRLCPSLGRGIHKSGAIDYHNLKAVCTYQWSQTSILRRSDMLAPEPMTTAILDSTSTCIGHHLKMETVLYSNTRWSMRLGKTDYYSWRSIQCFAKVLKYGTVADSEIDFFYSYQTCSTSISRGRYFNFLGHFFHERYSNADWRISDHYAGEAFGDSPRLFDRSILKYWHSHYSLVSLIHFPIVDP